jgi:exo-beta-1,3-glucanase (GH17 family)
MKSLRRFGYRTGLGVILAAAALVVAGASPSARGRPGQPAGGAARSFACNQPAPAAALGHVVLSGVGYGPYHAGQNPNLFISPSANEVTADMPTLAALTNYIRIYSSQGPAAEILQAAQAAHLCVALGISLGSHPAANDAEIASGIRLAQHSPAVRSVIVGNEVLSRNDLSVAQLLTDIRRVRAALGHKVAISYADRFVEWLAHPQLAKAVDFVTVHIYPFWQFVQIGSALANFAKDYAEMKKRFGGKPIVIGETGWPSAGPRKGRAVPSPADQARYFHGFVTWARQHAVRYFYFDAFDEAWKTTEHGVGTHWGLYDQGGHLKPALAQTARQSPSVPTATCSWARGSRRPST